MRALVILASTVALISGLAAAWYWYKSSKVPVGNHPIEVMALDFYDPKRLLSELNIVFRMMSSVSKLNAKAAIWSAVAAISGAASGFLSLWTSN